MPWSSCTTWSPTLRSRKLARRLPTTGPRWADGRRRRRTRSSGTTAIPSSRDTRPARTPSTDAPIVPGGGISPASSSTGRRRSIRARARDMSPRRAKATTTRSPARPRRPSSASASAGERVAKRASTASKAAARRAGGRGQVQRREGGQLGLDRLGRRQPAGGGLVLQALVRLAQGRPGARPAPAGPGRPRRSPAGPADRRWAPRARPPARPAGARSGGWCAG